ncbi:MAG: hypothetical protein HY556_02860 [Euryarchaeota archaeon]|nr:hypothetical protein [Euryarchaeota archaeon]
MQLYPYKMFNSIEFVALKRECSVCGKDPYMPECPHIPGELHMGEFVHATISDVQLLGVSLTDTPLDKRCIITAIEGEPTDNSNSMVRVKALAERALSPLQGFTVDETPREVSPKRYHKEGMASKCRCGSGKRFGTCCWRRRTMKVPWTHIGLEHPPSVEALYTIVPAAWTDPAKTLGADVAPHEGPAS